jgi:glycosyltransferase involved in cell wall biosynthesis
MADIQYLTLDSIQEGVGSSQVLTYVQKLAKNWTIELVSFEKDFPSTGESCSTSEGEFNWRPLPFGKYGQLAGLKRIWRLRKIVNKGAVIHARGDFAAFAAIIARSKRVIWDCRALTPDQRIAAKNKSRLSIEYIVLRLIEAVCAKKSQKIIVITEKAKYFLQSRYSIKDSKFLHVSTCVDLKRFRNNPTKKVKEGQPLKIAFIGTVGPQYDLDLIGKLLEELRKLFQVHFTVSLSPGSTKLYSNLKYDTLLSLTHREMPRFISSQDIGISIWRQNMGVSLLSVAATKNAEFLACGKPIIVNEHQGDIGGWVRDMKTGISTSSSDPNSLKRYVQEIIELMDEGESLSNRCRALAEKQYSLEDAVRQISKAYESLKGN